MLGLGLGDVVEATAKKLGLPAPKMSAAQMALTKTRAIGLFSSSLGISIGCIMGMVPLLFFEDDWTKEMREVFRALDVDGNGCEQYTYTQMDRPPSLSHSAAFGCCTQMRRDCLFSGRL